MKDLDVVSVIGYASKSSLTTSRSIMHQLYCLLVIERDSRSIIESGETHIRKVSDQIKEL